MNQCPHCSSYVDESAAFCSQCGGLLDDAERTPAVASSTDAVARPARRLPRRSSRGVLTLVAVCGAAIVVISLLQHFHSDGPEKELNPGLAGGGGEEAGGEPLPTIADRPGSRDSESGEDGQEALGLADLTRLAVAAVVDFELLDADRAKRPIFHGVLISDDGLVLSRYRPLLGAASGTCRIGGHRGVFEVLGVVELDTARDLALVKILQKVPANGAETRVKPLPALPPLVAEDAEYALEEGLDVLVASTGRAAMSRVVEYPYLSIAGVSSLRLEASQELPPRALFALDSYGYVVGLCRVETGESGAEGGALLVDPLGSLEYALSLEHYLTLEQFFAEYYAGTFAALMDEARRALRRNEHRVACRTLFRALERAVDERVDDDRVEGAHSLLARVLEDLRVRLQRENAPREWSGFLERALDFFPNDGELWLELARVYIGLENFREALDVAFRAAELLPGVEVDLLIEKSYLALAARSAQAGDLDGASELLLDGINALSGSARLHLELAKIYHAWEFFEDASRVYELAMELDPRLRTEVEIYLERIERAIKRRESVVISVPEGASSIQTTTLVNGRNHFRFIIDTGATFTAISANMARDLGIRIGPDRPRIQVSTANGTILVPVVKLDSVAIQGFTVRNLDALVLTNTRRDIGLLGLNFLNHFKYSYDSEHGELLLEQR